jgi:outer membrane protein assembly factor BamA
MACLAACNNTRYLTGNQQLYTGADVAIESTEKVKAKKELEGELKDLLRPKPNGKILGLRVKLWFYNIAGTPTGKGLRYWVKNKLGEPPVLASYSAFEKNRAVLQNRLENRGYFHDTVSFDTISKNKRVFVKYKGIVGKQYTIRQVSFPKDSSILSKTIDSLTRRRSRLRKDRPYDLDRIKDERIRIDAGLKQRGFYYFNPEFLVADVDSTVGNSQVDMDIKLKRETPVQAKRVYRINEVIVYADYNASDSVYRPQDTTHVDGYTIIDPRKRFNPAIYNRTLIFKSGDVYNRDDHNLSLNRLTTLGVFKFVKARFQETDTTKDPRLNAFYYLTPTERKSIRFEASALTKSNNANGGELSVTWRHRSLFKGAEQFNFSVYTGLEQQLSGQGNIGTRRIGATASLTIPRIIGPVQFNTNSGYIPKTKIELGYEIYSRSDQYTLTSSKASFGYIWKESANKEHTLNLISINYVKPTNITKAFQDRLDTNLTLARSIERQFIIGTNYNFNLNTQLNPNRNRHNFYFNGLLDLSGNTLGLITNASVDKGREREILGSAFAQYTKVELDFRHYLRLGRFSQFVSRITGGVGFAYGNSSVMPFVKEFFAGGTNDIRAFRSRSLGPGSYDAGDKDAAGGFLPDQPGDVKLEMNAEYRAKLFSVLRGAVFIDAGNVWTRGEDPNRPGSAFTKNFMSQVAVGAGVGLRVDVSILILRLDLAFPLRKPWLPEGERWVIKDISPFYGDWFSSNIVYNLAIGYPF